MVVMFDFTMAFRVSITVALVHAFVQDLGFLPTVLGAGRAKRDESGGSEEGEGDFLHEQGVSGGASS